MDPALAIVDRVLPKLEEQVGYRQAWRNALGARAYILNFKADHAAALAINERLVADYATDPQSPKFDHAVILSNRSEEHTSALQSLMRLSYAVFCLKTKKKKIRQICCSNNK